MTGAAGDVAAPPGPPPRHGCLRGGIVALLAAAAIAVAVAAAIVFFITDGRVERPALVARPPIIGNAPVPRVGSPPTAVRLAASLQRRVAGSVVRVTGTACEEVQQGSGFVVRPGYVVTDAHVVAGERATTVVDHAGRHAAATVVRFDPVRDLALLRLGAGVSRLPSLTLATPRAPADLAVFGHPGGGALRIAAARLLASGFVDAAGRDIFGHAASGSRRVLALAARLAPGDSGAPVVDAAGRVVAVAFAIDPAGRPVAYALAAAEVATVVRPSELPVPTGGCISP